MASRPGRFRCGSGFQAEGGKDREVEPPRLEGDEGRSGQAALLSGAGGLRWAGQVRGQALLCVPPPRTGSGKGVVQ